MTTQQSDDTIHVDRTPEDHQQAGSPSGEIFEEFGIVDLHASFPAKSYDWTPEFPDGDVVEEHDIDNPSEADVEEHHVVVPFRVVERGFSSRRHAKRAASQMNDGASDRYRAVRLTDTRGL